MAGDSAPAELLRGTAPARMAAANLRAQVTLALEAIAAAQGLGLLAGEDSAVLPLVGGDPFEALSGQEPAAAVAGVAGRGGRVPTSAGFAPSLGALPAQSGPPVRPRPAGSGPGLSRQASPSEAVASVADLASSPPASPRGGGRSGDRAEDVAKALAQGPDAGTSGAWRDGTGPRVDLLVQAIAGAMQGTRTDARPSLVPGGVRSAANGRLGLPETPAVPMALGGPDTSRRRAASFDAAVLAESSASLVPSSDRGGTRPPTEVVGPGAEGSAPGDGGGTGESQGPPLLQGLWARLGELAEEALGGDRVPAREVAPEAPDGGDAGRVLETPGLLREQTRTQSRDQGRGAAPDRALEQAASLPLVRRPAAPAVGSLRAGGTAFPEGRGAEPLDSEGLAELVSEALVRQARRHGVDLS
jgi:hypothetical protein